MRVAYIDEREEKLERIYDGKVETKSEKVYYSVLVKGGDKLDEVCSLSILFNLRQTI